MLPLRGRGCVLNLFFIWWRNQKAFADYQLFYHLNVIDLILDSAWDYLSQIFAKIVINDRGYIIRNWLYFLMKLHNWWIVFA